MSKYLQSIFGVIQIPYNYEYLLCISTSLWVLRAPKSWSKPFFRQHLECAAPKSWSKYTTTNTMLQIVYLYLKHNLERLKGQHLITKCSLFALIETQVITGLRFKGLIWIDLTQRNINKFQIYSMVKMLDFLSSFSFSLPRFGQNSRSLAAGLISPNYSLVVHCHVAIISIFD